MRFLRVSLGVLLLAVISMAALSGPSFVWAQQNEAASAISEAQSKLVNCFDAARSAEAAGANISQLTNTLNLAGSLLSNAELSYSEGNFGTAQSLATQSQNDLVDFISNANSLHASAAQSQTTSFLLNVVGSIVGTIAVLVGSILMWGFLKRRYRSKGVAKRESDEV